MDVSVKTIDKASLKLKNVVKKTPLEFNKRLSERYDAKIYFKREDLQSVRSYKIRGAYNLMSSLTSQEMKKGVVCASAGNHAQGVAQSSKLLKIKATIFMPIVTPLQKIGRVKDIGKGYVTAQLVGKTYDETCREAKKFAKKTGAIFVHPFDDERTISGQGTIGKEILEQGPKDIDYIICPIGGGGLISGIGTYFKNKNKNTKIIGAEPEGAPAMYESIKNNKVITLKSIDTFVDGAAVATVGQKSFTITSKVSDQILLCKNGKISTVMIELYQNEGIIAEPAGALSIAALSQLRDKIKGKTVVCILSGGNNDILRYPEIMEKSLVHQGLKHYFLIQFAQKPGQLKTFLNKVLGPADDIVLFEYTKKNSREKGPALVGIELTKKENLQPLLEKMNKEEIRYTIIKADDPLYSFVL